MTKPAPDSLDYDDLEHGRIVSELRRIGSTIGLPLVVESTTESTNDDARRAARAGAVSGATFVADSQTRGRGRLGRSWHSPPRTNLYASFVLRPAVPLASLGWISLAAGLAVADAVRGMATNSRIQIKWPNDVLLDGHKVAGVLSEAEINEQAPSFVIVGVGVNVRLVQFPFDLATRATSLALARVTDLDRGRLLVAICVALGVRIQLLERGLLDSLRTDLSAIDALAGKEVTVGGIRGRAMGIDRDGCLRVVGEDGIERPYRSGEASLHS